MTKSHIVAHNLHQHHGILGATLIRFTANQTWYIISSMDMLRLRWKPFGPLSTSIQVVDDALNPSSTQKPYQTDSDSFHPVSASAATEPPVSSITVKLQDLDD